jgi:hypothetical protein
MTSANRPPSVTMSDTAKRFLASLTPEQSGRATFKFEDDERMNWHFIPKERKGLPLKDMTSAQKHLANALLNAGLSQQGYIKATGIMSLEDVLRILEKDNGVRRNPEGYFFSIFGEPSETAVWGYRVEGHHLALNFTLKGGKVIGSPNFLGSNPAEVREGPRKGLRVLHAEEDLARALVTSLTPEQKKVAVVSQEAPKDIFTMASRKASIEGQPNGLQASKLNAKQRVMLQAVAEEYANNLPPMVAQERLDRIKKAGTSMYFVWAGGENKGDPHYYRIAAPDFLIEYDNTQNNANHIHSVWRDLTNDFGGDLLKEHYQSAHSKGTSHQ